jgi:hypothetical protein
MPLNFLRKDDGGFARAFAFAETQVKDVVDAIPLWRKQIEDAIAAFPSTTSQNEPQEHTQYPGTAYQLIRRASWGAAIATQVLDALPPRKSGVTSWPTTSSEPLSTRSGPRLPTGTICMDMETPPRLKPPRVATH